MAGHHGRRALLPCFLALAWAVSPSGRGAVIGAQAHPPVTAETVDAWMTELSNWGRWGRDDELGTVNLITPARRRQALALVTDGVSVSLARDAEKHEAIDNPDPWGQQMQGVGSGSFAMDSYTVNYHGSAHTHLDSLCHFGYRGRMFNGFSTDAVTAEGCERLSVINFKDGILTRGLLVDIPRLKGVEYLEPDVVIYPEDLDAWEKQTGLTVGPGDVVFIRTGRWARRDSVGPWNIAEAGAGLHVSGARWLKARDVAMVGSDFGTDVAPSGVEGVRFPLHQLLLVAMGTPLIDNCDLEALSRTAATRQRWEFLLTIDPLAVPGGTGSPVNPIATF